MALLTGRTALADVASGDLLHVIDVSVTTDNAAGSSRKATVTQLKNSFEELKSSFLNGGVANPLATQAGANLYTKARVKIDTCVTDGNSVKTMDAVAGSKQYFYNNTTKDVYIFPALGHNFLGKAVNLPEVVVGGGALKIFCFSTGEWTLV